MQVLPNPRTDNLGCFISVFLLVLSSIAELKLIYTMHELQIRRPLP